MQKQKSLIIFSMLIMGLCFFNSCEKDTFKDDVLSPTYIVKFSSDIKPIFTNRGCESASCHGGALPLNLKVDPYKSLMSNGDIDTTAPSKSILYVNISPNGNSNHLTKGTSMDLQLILQWIEQGAKNN